MTFSLVFLGAKVELLGWCLDIFQKICDCVLIVIFGHFINVIGTSWRLGPNYTFIVLYVSPVFWVSLQCFNHFLHYFSFIRNFSGALYIFLRTVQYRIKSWIIIFRSRASSLNIYMYIFGFWIERSYVIWCQIEQFIHLLCPGCLHILHIRQAWFSAVIHEVHL